MAGGSLSAPKTPILGIIGDRVVLPCQLGSAPVPGHFSIRWTFQGPSRRVLVSSYGGKGPREEPDERYRGRVEFFHEEFRAGNVSLLLRDVRSSDQGSYSCQLSCQGGSWEALLELEVAAMGEAPTIILQGLGKQGLALSCRSSGWFPRPELLLLDGNGEARPEPAATAATATPGGLFSAEASLRIRPGPGLEISCRALNPRLNGSRTARVRIHAAFFPSISLWLRIFLALLFLSLALSAAISCLLQTKIEFKKHFGKKTQIP
ncbi:hypothetical protein IHE44_0011016 [Lamprotornis superbus]|uniref:Ig-like domain-containing protein n=1 Tax=Lamprotornis superbus TaxID=245042 RepID=A0A835NE32_9PASS|nr:hypothetical protein IHE44_0011016 [Lamprotornis superbus]